jgi:hypothetical protein
MPGPRTAVATGALDARPKWEAPIVAVKLITSRSSRGFVKPDWTEWSMLEVKMRHDECHIGLEFYTATTRWRCTDMGTRTIVAIALDAPAESWYNGPPYAVREIVFDEDDFEGMSVSPDDVSYEPAARGVRAGWAAAADRLAAAQEGLLRDLKTAECQIDTGEVAPHDQVAGRLRQR